MTNQFASAYSRPRMAEFLRSKESEIKTQINNLKIGDVRDDAAFERTTMRLKKDLLLKTIELGEPKLTDHEYQQRQLSMQDQLMGMSRDRYFHKIEFPFSGDDEIMSYQPESFSFSSSDHGLILPSYGRIVVYVELPELNPQKAFAVARGLLSMNIQFITTNNVVVENWSKVISQHIDELLLKKREELKKIFG